MLILFLKNWYDLIFFFFTKVGGPILYPKPINGMWMPAFEKHRVDSLPFSQW